VAFWQLYYVRGSDFFVVDAEVEVWYIGSYQRSKELINYSKRNESMFQNITKQYNETDMKAESRWFIYTKIVGSWELMYGTLSDVASRKTHWPDPRHRNSDQTHTSDSEPVSNFKLIPFPKSDLFSGLFLALKHSKRWNEVWCRSKPRKHPRKSSFGDDLSESYPNQGRA
jgi:hypothetical protein